MSTGTRADVSHGAFHLDSTVPGAASRGLDAFRRGWETQLGGGFRLPAFSPATIGDFRVKGRAARLSDVTIADLHGASATRTVGAPRGEEDLVRMYVVRQGAWDLDGPRERDEHTVSAGQFLLRHFGHPSAFATAAHTTAKILFLPTAMLGPLLGNRTITGPVDSAEVRLLAAHANMVHETIADLSPAGVHAAHSTLIELAKAVAQSRFDDMEPLLAPSLAQAAKDLADSHLADPELSPAMLARELRVSVRTLQRAFATAGESATAYIRDRRLEEARLALTAGPGRPSVSELAAHWQFADSSHFIRAFKKRYGRTPTEYARSTGSPTGPTGPTRQ
ncbi:helix-turn-helix domain-containing protein [Streptomyces sp. NPDC058694]|uniref:helix-turn-helix domain-containing protein n=1 Tax=Streptomyces sp. NPDC058694 TaxID=3346603 RepID=UPI003652F39F